jgi:hypothetical protein
MKYLGVIIFLFLLGCCDKENRDYRDVYIGNYYFQIIYTHWIGPNSHIDTTIYSGYVKKKGNTTDRIIIRFGDDIWGGDSLINDYPEPILKPDGTLEYPEYPTGGGNVYFGGKFISYDSLNFIMSYGGMGGGQRKDVFGHKKY